MVGYQCPFSTSVLLIYIRQSSLLTIPRLQKPASELTYLTASSSFVSTIETRVLTPRSTNYVIMVSCSYCDRIAIGDILYRYGFIRNQFINKYVPVTRWQWEAPLIYPLGTYRFNDWSKQHNPLFDYSSLQPNIQHSATELLCNISNREYPTPLQTYEPKVPFVQSNNVWSN